MKRIIVAGGCFWGVEGYFARLKGVVKTTVGYVNGNKKNPTYEEVCNGVANHAEGCELLYDPEIIPLEKILEHMFRFIDPTSLNKQGNDVGVQYRTGVYYEQEEDREFILEFLKEKQKDYIREIVVEVEKIQNYFLAEDYHQDYLDKNPSGYCHVNFGLIKKEERK